MLELTKKPHTSGMTEICIRVSEDNSDAIIQKILTSLQTEGYDVTTREEPTYSAEEVLGAPTPARLLRGARTREGMTQEQLANAVGCKKHHISEMENNKRSIGKNMAHRLAEALNTDYRNFL
ncbi:helix-turn-helix domain-containing protein [Halodesulfovibrio spirochaetisodalis]|uniref:HTH cro/C1-type domain-containing protein n=1 Tax=Halodesulfovibrio spirochaetisodalis TaxID=1560234 RepID=A0A1B7XQ41_9BACT|nr:helix-turn-helix transcriptional regulator [Halodesulfovibrio spirochaetisodalis]OBQ57638.1 hypothetical protein SP90_00960 [Halodesulfovibrio spirochaetisodalis]